MDAVVAKVLLVLFIVNVVLTAAKNTLDALVVKFPSLQKADSVIGTIVSGLSKVIGFLSANTQTPPKA